MTHLEVVQSKIYADGAAFLPLLKQWRQAGETVVFTNGCFDLVHRGHVDSLAKAADFGTKLIVGLNSDQSVKMLKGSDRPLVDQQSRAVLLAALSMVDAVVIFQEETPYQLIASVVPDVLVKGAEYRVEEIAGSDVVLASGGKVERIDLTDGFSTTELIRKIKNT